LKTSKDGKQKTEEGYLGESRVEPEDNQGVLMPSTTVPESQAIALQYCTFRGNRLQEPTHVVRGRASQLRNRRIPDGTYGGVRGRWVNYLITQLLLD